MTERARFIYLGDVYKDGSAAEFATEFRSASSATLHSGTAQVFAGTGMITRRRPRTTQRTRVQATRAPSRRPRKLLASPSYIAGIGTHSTLTPARRQRFRCSDSAS